MFHNEETALLLRQTSMDAERDMEERKANGGLRARCHNSSYLVQQTVCRWEVPNEGLGEGGMPSRHVSAIQLP